jgi:hypothetical protein
MDKVRKLCNSECYAPLLERFIIQFSLAQIKADLSDLDSTNVSVKHTILQTGATCSGETLIPIYQGTWRHIPKDHKREL